MRVKQLFLLAILICLAGTRFLAAQGADRVVAAHYPPLMIEGATERPGYAIEVIKEAARRAGRDVDITFFPFERAIFEVVNGPAVMMPSLFQGKPYDGDIRWVAEIQRAELRFASLSQPIHSLDDARHLQAIVVERGTTSETLLTALGFENMQTTPSPVSSANMLAAERADAWLLTERMMRSTWARMQMEKPLQIGGIVHAVPVFIASSLSLPDDVATAYADAIREMRADGTLARLLAIYVP